MKRIVSVCAVLAFAMVKMASAADAAKPAEELRREAQTAANSNSVETPLPQLGPNPHVGPEVPMQSETNPLLVPRVTLVEKPTPAEPQPRRTLWMILAVLSVVAGSFLLQRWRSRSSPP